MPSGSVKADGRPHRVMPPDMPSGRNRTLQMPTPSAPLSSVAGTPAGLRRQPRSGAAPGSWHPASLPYQAIGAEAKHRVGRGRQFLAVRPPPRNPLRHNQIKAQMRIIRVPLRAANAGIAFPFRVAWSPSPCAMLDGRYGGDRWNENLCSRRLSRHRADAGLLQEARRPRRHDLERPCPGHRRAGRAAEGHRGAGPDPRAHPDPRAAARPAAQAQADQPAQRLSAHRHRRLHRSRASSCRRASIPARRPTPPPN